jgi:hypothetical protein
MKIFPRNSNQNSLQTQIWGLICPLESCLKHAIFIALRFPNGKFLVSKYEFGGSFGMSLERYYHEVEATPNLEFLVTFGMSLEGVCLELYTKFHYKLIPNLEVTKNSLKKLPPN